jgi:thioredoxin-like negative regulator of GroEL
MSETTPRPTVAANQASAAKIDANALRPAPPKGWRKLLPFQIQRTDSGLRVAVDVKRAMVTLLASLLIGWLCAAGAAYLFVKYRRGFTDVRISHMLLYPWKKEEYRVARGDFIIEEAKAALEEQNYREAFQGLRMGASLSPGNRDGRMLLAQFYVIWQRPDLAQKLLVEGLESHSRDAEYLKTLFSFLLQRQADAEVVRITEELLKDNPASIETHSEQVQMTAMARATAQFFRGNYDAAEDTLRNHQLNETVDGQILALRIEWERGERGVALGRLQALTEQIPENEQIYAQYAAYLRETGRDDELRRLCVLRQLSFPDRPRARIDLLYLYDKAGDEAGLSAGVEALFQDFSTNGEVLLALADFAANTGRPALARRVYDHCKQNNLPWEGPALMTIEAHVVAREYRQSLEACRQMIKDNQEWGKRFYSVFNGLQAIANFGLKDTEAAQLFLSNFLNQSGVRAENLVAVSSRLIDVGAKDQARQVLAQAVKADPMNQTALAGLIRIDLDLGEADTIPVHLRTLLSMRKPPQALLRSAYDKLASDRYVFLPKRAVLLLSLIHI